MTLNKGFRDAPQKLPGLQPERNSDGLVSEYVAEYEGAALVTQENADNFDLDSKYVLTTILSLLQSCHLLTYYSTFVIFFFSYRDERRIGNLLGKTEKDERRHTEDNSKNLRVSDPDPVAPAAGTHRNEPKREGQT